MERVPKAGEGIIKNIWQKMLNIHSVDYKNKIFQSSILYFYMLQFSLWKF